MFNKPSLKELLLVQEPKAELKILSRKVVLPRPEYEALLDHADQEAEDAEDVAIYDARKAEKHED